MKKKVAIYRTATLYIKKSILLNIKQYPERQMASMPDGVRA